MLILFELYCLLVSYVHPKDLGQMLETFPWTAWGTLNDAVPTLYAQAVPWLVVILTVTAAVLIPRVRRLTAIL